MEYFIIQTPILKGERRGIKYKDIIAIIKKLYINSLWSINRIRFKKVRMKNRTFVLFLIYFLSFFCYNNITRVFMMPSDKSH